MANVSSDLIWQVTRNNSSFLVKRNGLSLTSEPNNPSNINSAKFSGLANSKTADVRAQGSNFVITMKKTKDQTKPKKSLRIVKIKAADPRRVAKTVDSLVSKSFYRPAIGKLAVARVGKLAQATVRANKMAKDKLIVRYGRGAKPFDFNPKKRSVTKPTIDEDLPPLTAASENPIDEMD